MLKTAGKNGLLILIPILLGLTACGSSGNNGGGQPPAAVQPGLLANGAIPLPSQFRFFNKSSATYGYYYYNLGGYPAGYPGNQPLSGQMPIKIFVFANATTGYFAPYTGLDTAQGSSCSADLRSGARPVAIGDAQILQDAYSQPYNNGSVQVMIPAWRDPNGNAINAIPQGNYTLCAFADEYGDGRLDSLDDNSPFYRFPTSGVTTGTVGSGSNWGFYFYSSRGMRYRNSR